MAGVLALGLLSAGCATSPAVTTLTPRVDATTAGESATPSSKPSDASCADYTAALSPTERAGQVVMVGVYDNLDTAERAALDATPFGSVLLLGKQDEGMARMKQRTAALAEYGGDSGMLIAADQEGGKVQRVTGSGFDTIPAATEQAQLTDKQLTSDATTWGSELEEAGILLNLAPVADTVDADHVADNAPIGALDRGYGSDPDQVAAKVTAFIAGMHSAGVATSAKHFPNLGEVTGNTDFASGVTDTVTTATSDSQQPFAAAVDAGSETIMVATATYEKIDPDHPAAFSADVMDILRDDLGFTGVIISDDLGAAASMTDVPARQRGVNFIAAGGDLAISADPTIAQSMVEGLVAQAESDDDFDAQLTRSAQRVLDLKRGLGLTTCTAKN